MRDLNNGPVMSGSMFERAHPGLFNALCFVTRFTLLAAVLIGCSDGDGMLPPGGPGHVEVDSDPRGASIFVDGQDRRRTTPDTLHGLSGLRDLTVRLDSAGASYGYHVQFRFSPDSVARLFGPLILSRCAEVCGLVSEHTAAGLRFSRAPAGLLFYRDGSGDGLFWPAASTHSYSSTGIPVFAAQLDGQVPVALGIYDNAYLSGRPFPSVTNTGGLFGLNQSFWVMPPASVLSLPTVRGLEVTEELIGESGVADVLVLRLVFRNISNRPAYRVTDPYAPEAGFQFQDAYIGFALDPDIGEADDDLFTYDPELNAVIAYDAAFREDGFHGSSSTQPGLVGLRLLEAPPPALRILNGWPRVVGGGAADWAAGTLSEEAGWHILSGSSSYPPDHVANTMGHMPGSAVNDMRMAVSAGPLNLAPGDSAVIRVALALAGPAAGTFTSGTIIDSGDPSAPGRTIMLIAAQLRDRLRAAEAIR